MTGFADLRLNRLGYGHIMKGWYPERDSNSQTLGSKPSDFANLSTGAHHGNLVA
jgi:hypothetical protein